MKQSSPFKWSPSTKQSDNSLSEPKVAYAKALK